MKYSMILSFAVVIFILVVQSLGRAIDESVALQWNITASAAKRSKNSGIKRILHNNIGKVGTGKLHIILGPSGSGKTTLLNALAGITPKSSMALDGDLYSQNHLTPIFIPQDDLLFAQLTVEETLNDASMLRQIKNNGGNNKNSLDKSKLIIDNITRMLGLKKVMSTKVGDVKTRGISGGEKKRLSIGQEIIDSTEKNIIFCDEPTSGLDSYQALKIIELFKDLSNQGNTIVASIHQPRSSILELFDEITILAEGKTIYSGTMQQLVPYFSRLGYPCPAQTNPAEYYIDLVSIDYSTSETEKKCRDRIQNLSESFASYYQQKSSVTTFCTKKIDSLIVETKPKRGLKHFFLTLGRKVMNSARVFQILFTRAFRQVIRDKTLNIARLASSLSTSILYGLIYFKLGLGASTVPDRLGLLNIASISVAMTTVIKVAQTFASERLILSRERRSNLYPMSTYFISKLLAEVPISALFPCISGTVIYFLCGLNQAPGKFLKFLLILTGEALSSAALGLAVGSISQTPEAAVAIAPAVMLIFIVFGGIFVVNVPWYLKWVPLTSVIRWGYEALCINEFTGLKLTPTAKRGPLSVSTGEEVLESLGLASGKTSILRALKAQGLIMLVNYVFTYISLLLQRPAFEKIRPNKDNTAEICAALDDDILEIKAARQADGKEKTDSGRTSATHDEDNEDEIVLTNTLSSPTVHTARTRNPF